MFLGRTDKAHDLHIVLCPFFGSEATGNLLLYLAETDGSFYFIIGERDRPISRKAQNIPPVIAQSLQ